MSGEISKVFTQFKKNISNQSAEGAVLTIILVLVIIIITINIFRVIEKGFLNYNVYLSEQDLLQKEIEKNERLSEVLEYYESPETKRVLAREVLNLAPDNELIYETREEPRFFEEDVELLEFSELGSYKAQWLRILPFW